MIVLLSLAGCGTTAAQDEMSLKVVPVSEQSLPNDHVQLVPRFVHPSTTTPGLWEGRYKPRTTSILIGVTNAIAGSDTVEIVVTAVELRSGKQTVTTLNPVKIALPNGNVNVESALELNKFKKLVAITVVAQLKRDGKIVDRYESTTFFNYVLEEEPRNPSV